MATSLPALRQAYLRGAATLDEVKAAEEAARAQDASIPPLPPTSDVLADVLGCIHRLCAAHEQYGAGRATAADVRRRDAEFRHEWGRLTAAWERKGAGDGD